MQPGKKIQTNTKTGTKPQSSQSKRPSKPEIYQNKGKTVSKQISTTEIKERSSTSIPPTKQPITQKNKNQNQQIILKNEADFDDYEEERKESAHFPVNYQENSMNYQDKPMNFQDQPINFPEKKMNFQDKSNNFPKNLQEIPKNFQEKPKNFQEKQINFIEKPKNFQEKQFDLSENPKKSPIYQEEISQKKQVTPKNIEIQKSKIDDNHSKKFETQKMAVPLKPHLEEFQNKFEENLEEINNKENKINIGPYDSLNKRQILQKLTEKVYILTDELEKLSKITSQSMEDNRAWKGKYSKLKDLYLKNVDEDLNPEIYFEGAEYSLDFKSEIKPEKRVFDEKINNLNAENQKLKKNLKSCQENIEEFLQKINNSKKNNQDFGLKLKDLEVGYQNKIKILQNELEILKTDQSNRNKFTSEEKYEKLLKNFLALKEEKDQTESNLQRKLQELEKNEGVSSNLITIPNEENIFDKEKLGVQEKSHGVTPKNLEKDQKKIPTKVGPLKKQTGKK